METENKTKNKPKRKRGAQPGNLNAFKHGFYSKRSIPIDDKKRDDILPSKLDDEIAMLRTATVRIFQLAKKVEDIDQAIKALGALGLASIRTSRLLKVQKELGNGDQALSIISAAINEVLKEWEWE